MALSAFALLVAAQNSASGTGPPAGTGYTPASFTTVSSSLLVVALAPNENGSSSTNVPSTITVTNSAGLTLTLQKAQSAGITFDPGVMIWTAPVTSGGSMTVTFTSTVNMGTYGVVIGYYTGHDTSTPVLGTGGTAKSAGIGSPETGTFTLSNAPLVGDEIFAVANNNQATNTTPGSGWTEIADVANSSWANIETQTIRGVTSTTVVWTDLFATSGGKFDFATAAIVIKAAAGATTIAPDGVSVPVTLGSPALSDASMAVAPAGISAPVALGAPTLAWSATVAPDGITVPVAVGSPLVGAAPVAPDGITVPVTLGSPTLTWSGSVAPDGITVAVALGTPTLHVPGSVVARPNTGTVTRPSTGVVARPNTGLVTRP